MDQQESDRAPDVPPGSRVTADARQPVGLVAQLAASQAALLEAQREIGTMRDALAAARDREGLLVHELQHRVRNMLAVIRSIYRRTREIGASQEEFAEHFQGRLDAVARYHSHVGDAGPSGIDLEEIIRDELLKVHFPDGPGCTINGPPVLLRAKSAELMGLAVHELTTNSIKFGALAQGGTLVIDWSLQEAAEGPLLRFRWTEDGVSPVACAPRPFGFGRQLIEEALPYQLGATTSFDMRPGGIACSILLPLPGADAGAEKSRGSADGMSPPAFETEHTR